VQILVRLLAHTLGVVAQALLRREMWHARWRCGEHVNYRSI
jgi:hypothetical protein